MGTSIGVMKETKPIVRIFDGPEELARGGADEFLDRARAAIDRRGRFTVALSGGSTPKRLFRHLATETASGGRTSMPWGKVHCFWVDERMVPADHPDSNFGAARDHLLSRVSIPSSQVHPILTGGGDPAEAAGRYEKELVDFFGLREGELPGFDLILLGMGEDGHTASLFPGSGAVREERRLVAAPWVEKLGVHRVTLTFPVLNRAACVIFLVSGTGKAGILKEVLEGECRPERYPAQRMRPESGELFWFLDRPASGALVKKAINPNSTRGIQGGIDS